jgi:hypothetical protein
LSIIYTMLRDRSSYRDLVDTFFDRLNRESVLRRAIRRIENLGYSVTLASAPPKIPETIAEVVFSYELPILACSQHHEV